MSRNCLNFSQNVFIKLIVFEALNVLLERKQLLTFNLMDNEMIGLSVNFVWFT